MDGSLKPCREYAQAYYNDIPIGGYTAEECANRTQIVLNTLQQYNFTINMEKSVLILAIETQPLYLATRADPFTLTEANIKSFNNLKEEVAQLPKLRTFNPDLPIILETDASRLKELGPVFFKATRMENTQ